MLLNVFFIFIIVCCGRLYAVYEDDRALKYFQEYYHQSHHLLNGKKIDRNWWFFPNGTIYPEEQKKTNGFFPEDAPGDRILEQLIYIPYKYTNDTKREDISINIGYITDPMVTSDVFRSCPVNKCRFIKEKELFSTSDVILVDRSKMPPDDHRYPGQLWIFHTNECPYYARYKCETDVINWTMTYREDSDIVIPYARWIYYDPNIRMRKQNRNYALGKSKMVAWVVSNCWAKNERWMYAIQLSKLVQVDIYGDCGEYNCSNDHNGCLKMLEKDYKFYLSFENSNCRDYITEKFFRNALSWSVVPIVMGAQIEDYERVAPQGSFVHVEEFPSPEELAGYLKKLNSDDDLYNSYFRWKGTGELLFNTYEWCRLCAMLHAPRTKRHYGNFTYWWHSDSCRKTPWNVQLNHDVRLQGSSSRIKGYILLYLFLAINLMLKRQN